MDVSLNLPVAFSVRDHHEFQAHRDVLQRIHPDLTIQEVATGIHVNGGPTVYWGLVYIKGQVVTDEVINSCLQLAGFHFGHNGKNYTVEV